MFLGEAQVKVRLLEAEVELLKQELRRKAEVDVAEEGREELELGA